METIVSVIMSDLLSRALSMVIQRYRRSKAEEAEHKIQRLHRVLIRVDAMVEEAEGRHITNQAMLRQLDMLRQGMYGGHYMLDTVRYRGHGHGGDDEMNPIALSRFSSTKLQDESKKKKLDKILDGLETLIGDMAGFTLFLAGYPRICKKPYSVYLVLDKVMFGRAMEKETVVNFLLQPETVGDRNPGVLPIVGAARVGKSTLVEHVCLDERVRRHFTSIVIVTGDNPDAGNMAALGRRSDVRHEDGSDPSSGTGRSLVVIELAGDMDEETWRKLVCSASRCMGYGGKIIITSRSEKIAALGTTQALKLRFLPRDVYWYFFKALAFGSANPDDQPNLASMGMEIAVLLNGTFVGANIVASLMRANLSANFWRRVLQSLRDFTGKHLRMFGENPKYLLLKGRPVHALVVARSKSAVVISKVYQQHSAQRGVPKLTAQDILAGRATHQGKFRAMVWRSSIPPYCTYLACCGSLTDQSSTTSKKRRRQDRD